MATGGRIVIIGAGFGGLMTAIYAAKTDPEADILLIDKNDFHVYTPWVYEVVTGGLMERVTKNDAFSHSCGAPITSLIKQYKNIRFKKGEVVACDFEEKHVLLQSGRSLTYEKLVLALGSQPFFYGIPGVDEYAYTLMNESHIFDLRLALHKALSLHEARLVVAGAGAAGVELVTELANCLKRNRVEGLQITILDAAPALLGRFPKFIQHYASKRLQRLGVEVHMQAPVSKVTAVDVSVRQDGNVHKIPYTVFVWSGGVQPSEVLKSFDLPKDKKGRLHVLPTLQVEGHPDVYAVGDLVAYVDERTEVTAPPAAWAAIKEAKVLGKNLVRERQVTLKMPKRFPALMTMGGRNAVGVFSLFPLFGLPAFIARRLVDLRYWMRLLPFRQAFSIWKKRMWLFNEND